MKYSRNPQFDFRATKTNMVGLFEEIYKNGQLTLTNAIISDRTKKILENKGVKVTRVEQDLIFKGGETVI